MATRWTPGARARAVSTAAWDLALYGESYEPAIWTALEKAGMEDLSTSQYHAFRAAVLREFAKFTSLKTFLDLMRFRRWQSPIWTVQWIASSNRWYVGHTNTEHVHGYYQSSDVLAIVGPDTLGLAMFAFDA